LAYFTIISKSQANVKQNRSTLAKKGYVKILTISRTQLRQLLFCALHVQLIYRIAKSASGILFTPDNLYWPA
jgi:hypothetical protein